jgi:hypothetical protein
MKASMWQCSASTLNWIQTLQIALHGMRQLFHARVMHVYQTVLCWPAAKHLSNSGHPHSGGMLASSL